MIAFRFPDEIPSAVTFEEARFLWENGKNKRVLELGAQYGLSTVVFSQSALKVVSVDWHRGDRQAGHQNTAPIYLRNLHRHRASNVVPIIGKFMDVLPLLAPEQFDVVFVDGCHDEPAVATDVFLALPLLKRPGTMLFHDYGRFDGVTVTADRLATINLTRLHSVGSVASVQVTKVMKKAA